jgi:hypothetical protein
MVACRRRVRLVPRNPPVPKLLTQNFPFFDFIYFIIGCFEI